MSEWSVLKSMSSDEVLWKSKAAEARQRVEARQSAAQAEDSTKSEESITVASSSIKTEPTSTSQDRSCEQRVAEAGLKFDGGKPMMTLVPQEALLEVAKVMTFGASKYGPHNWRKGISVSRYLDALGRHYNAYCRGEDLDPETGISHLAHVCCCAMMIMETLPAWDDRWKDNEDGD